MAIEYDTSFIKPEIRAGWNVSKKMKKVWWVQIDLIKQLDYLCKKNGLRWYPMWGTLLGAVRHHGYIPWDDDIDIVMPRNDYEKFLIIAKKSLKKPYFLQTTLTDKECMYMWASLRNSNTTGNRSSCLSKKQNNGIGIDIMPLDGCCNNKTMYKISRLPVRIVSVLANTYVNEFNNSVLAVVIRKALRTIGGFNYKKAYIWCEKQNKKHKWENSEKVAFRAHADPLTKVIERDMWLKCYFDEVIPMPFENITIPVPREYDKLLHQIYGNYMELPPLNKRKGKHDMIYEPDIPYKEYYRKHRLELRKAK